MEKASIIKRRLSNAGLVTPYRDSQTALDQLMGIQAQYYHYALFNLFQRIEATACPAASELGRDRLVLAWGQRDTLHLYTLPTWQRVNAFLPYASWVGAYFDKLGIDLASEMRNFVFLTGGQALTIQAIKDLYQERWSPIFAWSALFLAQSRMGCLYFSPEVRAVRTCHFYAGEQTKAPERVDMARRYFKAYGPATIQDLCHFYGMKQRDWQPKTDFAGLAWFEMDRRRYYYIDEVAKALPLPVVTLLGKFDPLLVGYHHKDLLIPAAYHKLVWGKAGQIAPVVLVKGAFAGLWQMRQSGKKLTVKVQLRQAYDDKDIQVQIEEKLLAFATWVGKTKVGFSYETLELS